jgi:hypothetical protein
MLILLGGIYVAQFNLRIPQEMEEDFEAYKGRFNVSAVCHAAIKSEIAALKTLDKAIGDRDKLIARWAKEQAMSRSRYYKEGLEQGKADSPVLGYEDVEAIGQLVNDGKDGAAIVDYVTNVLGWATFDDSEDWFPDVPERSRGQAINGWVNGVYEVWSELRGEVESASLNYAND